MTTESADVDEYWMRAALDLARNGQGFVEPNPMVGCLLVKDGTCIGRGFHRRFGGPHAEVDALSSLNHPDGAKGATAYVTLEPCCHHGKTPPCSDALINAQVSRVVIAMRDPFPQVDGGGIRQLSEAGIRVTCGVLQSQAHWINAPYLKRLKTGQPWVIAKWAMTIDGRIATATGQSQWISGSHSRKEVHRLRGRVDAILVGTGTVDKDNPMLTARLDDDSGKPVKPPRLAERIVLCRRHLPAISSNLVATSSQVPTRFIVGPQIRRQDLDVFQATDVRVEQVEQQDDAERTAITLQQLARRGMTNVMLECGPGLLASFIGPDGESLIDEYHVYVGAKVFGGSTSPGPVGGKGIEDISNALLLSIQQIDRFGDDVRLIYRRHSTASWLVE